jgi:hypothetical protein
MKNEATFTRPVIILGAPRSGTTLLQKIIREQPGFASMAKESDIIWNRYFHPKYLHWRSEIVNPEDVSEKTIEAIRREFASYQMSSDFWTKLEMLRIMRYKRNPLLAFFIRNSYRGFAAIRSLMPGKSRQPLRLVEKTIANCFRIGVVDRVFPDARYIYVKRDGRGTINSIIRSWLDPNRFFSYDLPMELDIGGYPYKKWNFVLPPGWEKHISKPLEEVAAFQWMEVHRAIREELKKTKYEGRVLEIKLEDLTERPVETLREICDFAQISWSPELEKTALDLPVVNSPDEISDPEKWRFEHAEMVKRIEPMISDVMKEIGYPPTSG